MMALWKHPLRNIFPGHRGAVESGLLTNRSFHVDATLGNDANTGRTPSDPWQTIAKVNGEMFLPGDRILLIRDGEWREQLTAPFSGTAGEFIAFDAYGSGAAPIINGSNIITGWTAEGTPNVWEAAVTQNPEYAVWMDDTLGTEQANIPALSAEYDWYWAANVLYIYAATDPDTRYTSPGVEAASRYACVDTDTQDYIQFKNLKLLKARVVGIEASVSGTGLMFDGIESQQNGDNNAYFSGLSDLVLRSCTVHDSVNGHGIYLSGTAGTMSGVLIEDCISYANGTFGVQINPNDVARIENVIMRRCHVYGNTSTEIRDRGSDGTQYINNLIRNAGTTGICLAIEHQGAFPELSARDAKLYHNTMVVDAAGTGISISSASTGNIAKNNIIHCQNTATRLIEVDNPGELTSDNNQFYLTAAANRYDWHGNISNSLAGWQTDSSQDASSDDADPAFVNLANDWHLLVGSPCRGAGAIGTGVINDYDGVTRGSPPDIGAYEYVP